MAIYTYDYNFSYIPSAPFVKIEVNSMRSKETVSLDALIDSGADGSMLPNKVIKQLRAPRVDTKFYERLQESVHRLAYIESEFKLARIA